MKTTTIQILVFFIVFISSNVAFGLNYNANANLYDHLFEINENWKFHKGEVPNETVSFNSDIERIQTHLLLVEKSLRSVSTSNLNKQQHANRLKTLSILHQYVLDSKFPINTGHSIRQPYFIDIYGTHCAVGFLVKETGFAEISKAISEKQNFAYVKEIVSPELVKWSEDFGFTLEELAWIQPAYQPTQTYSQVGGGTNGTVTHTFGYINRLFIAGNFSELNNLPCLNVGYYESNQLNCFGNGIYGKIVGVAENGPNGVIVAGEFEQNGEKFPMAKFDGTSWSYFGVPGIQNAVATCFSSVQNSQFIEIAITAPSIPNGQEIWRFYAGQWSRKAKVSGLVFAIFNGSKETYAGNFNSIEIFSNNVGTIYQANNFISFNPFSGQWGSSLSNVPDTIRTILVQGNSLYLGGDSPSGTNDVILSRHLNGVAQPLLMHTDFETTQNYPEIKTIQLWNNSELVVGGRFSSLPFGIGTFGNNLLRYNIGSSAFEPISLLDSTINSISWMNNRLYVGGAFTKNTNSLVQDKKHLIVLDSELGISEENLNLEFTLSPNPSNGNLSIGHVNAELIKSIEILDLQGKVCHAGKTNNLNLTHLKAGTYFVRIETTTGSTSTKKWVKE